MMCWWAEDPNGEEFKYHLARVPDYLWLAEDGMKVQVDFCQDILNFGLIIRHYQIRHRLYI